MAISKTWWERTKKKKLKKVPMPELRKKTRTFERTKKEGEG